MLQRIGLAQALVHDPDLVLLDEPTDGVDPVGRRDILNVLDSLRGKGKTVFINSHALSELETICDRVAILVKGQVARQGTIDELTIARQRYEIELVQEDPSNQRQRILLAIPAQWQPPVPMPATMNAAARLIDRGSFNGSLSIELDGAILRLGTTDPQQVQPVIDSLRQAGLSLRRVQVMRPSLEDLFLDTVTDPTTGRVSTPGAARIQRTGARA
jgi:ABC-2 type transport system ATP-binding protein